MMLNHAKVEFATNEKHLVLILDSTLDFIEHIDNKINKCYKIIGMMKRSSLRLSKNILLKIHKNYTSLMLKDTKVQFSTSQIHLV